MNLLARVFVYGSLMRGFHNNHLLADAEFLGERTAIGFFMYSLGSFPGVMDVGGRSQVRGELYLVDEETLARLDRLEGHPRFYARVRTRLTDGTEAWIYVLPLESVYDKPRVYSGSWREATS